MRNNRLVTSGIFSKVYPTKITSQVQCSVSGGLSRGTMRAPFASPGYSFALFGLHNFITYKQYRYTPMIQQRTVPMWVREHGVKNTGLQRYIVYVHVQHTSQSLSVPFHMLPKQWLCFHSASHPRMDV